MAGCDNGSPTSSPPPTFTVTFDSAGGSAVDEITDVAHGATITAPTEPTRADYAFQHWYLSNPAVPFVFSTPITASITLRAHWESAVTFTVTFNTHNGIPVPDEQNVEEGGFAARPATDPTRDGYNFTDWYTEEIGGSVFNFAATPINANTVVHARWQAVSGVTTFTVTFNSAGGTAVEAQEVADGETASEPTSPTRAFTPGAGLWANPLPADYTFNHWSAPGETGPFAFTTTPVTGNITLTAQWTAPTPIAGVPANNVAVVAAVNHVNANPGHFTLLVGQVQAVTGVLTINEGAHLTIRRTGNGTIFTLNGANISLTLGNNITLSGHSGNNAPLVLVQGGARLTMNAGARITGNTASGNNQAGGVHVDGAGSVFTMNGGVISGNAVTALLSGGGVRIGNGASFRMYGGYIEDNEARSATGAIGGGVFINQVASTFYMLGGTIRNNRAPTSATGAGGVRISNGALRMVSGVIYGSDEGANSNTGAGHASLMLPNVATGTAHRGTLDGNGNWDTASAVALVPGTGERGDSETIRVANGQIVTTP